MLNFHMQQVKNLETYLVDLLSGWQEDTAPEEQTRKEDDVALAYFRKSQNVTISEEDSRRVLRKIDLHLLPYVSFMTEQEMALMCL